jgi:glycosyltransferase involved in cell wall biosynthesis
MAIVAIDVRVIGQKRTGDETVFLELVRALIREHSEHQYLLLTAQGEEGRETLRQRIMGQAVLPEHVKVMSFSHQNKFWWNAVTLPRYFFQEKSIDVFHTQYILPFFLPRRLKVVAHIHDISFARFPELIGWRDRSFLRLLIPRTLRRAFLVAPSLFTKQEIMAVYGVSEEKITVIPNALSQEFVVDGQRQADWTELQTKYLLPEKYILYVGTLQPRKNIPYLLQAFALVEKRLPKTQLVLVGNREGHHYDQSIDDVIRAEGLAEKVVFPGYVEASDLPHLYQHASVFVFLSRYEGFGIPLLEAIVSGVPVLASDIPPHREVGGEKVTYAPLDNLVETSEILYTLCVQGGTRDTSERYAVDQRESSSWSASASLLAHLYQKRESI